MAISKRRRTLLVVVPAVLVVCAAIAGVLAFVVDWNKGSTTDSAPTNLPTSDAGSGAKLVNNEGTESKILNQWLVTFYEDAPIDAVVEELQNSGMPWFVNETWHNASAMYMFCDETMLNDAMGMPLMNKHAKYVEPDRVINITSLWGLDRINQRNLPLDNKPVSAGTSTGSGVNVYILDTGIRTTHEQFGGRATAAIDFVKDGNGATDCNGHGTHVAGTVGGRTYGVAKKVNLHAVRVLGCTGSGANSGVISGINWVTTNHVKPAIASMSLGGGASTALDSALRTSVARGVTYIVAAGNENTNACNGSPARVPEAVTVGATTSSDARASYSNYGSCLDIFAPGSSISSAWYTADNAGAVLSGTSMATPHVSGVAALYLQNNPQATPAQVSAALLGAATSDVISGVGTGSPNKNLYWSDGSSSSTTARATTGVATTARATTARATTAAATTARATTAAATTGAATTGRSTTGAATTAVGTTGAPSGNKSGPCAALACVNETGSLGSSGAVAFHPSGNYYYSKNGGTFQSWLVGPLNADFDLALYKWTSNTWLKVAGSETGGSQESLRYSGTKGYYTWRVRSYDGTGSYVIAMSNPL